MALTVKGSNIYDGDILVARCLTSVSADHEVTKEMAEALAKRLVGDAMKVSETKEKVAPKKVVRKKRAGK